MTDEPPPPTAHRVHRRGPRGIPEPLFEFWRAGDASRWRCTLRDHGPYGVAIEFWMNDTFYESRMFPPRLELATSPRDRAVAWAREKRTELAP